jgi:hypothetical protein
MIIASLFIIAKQTNKRTNNKTSFKGEQFLWHICTVDYSSVVRRDESLIWVTTWMNLQRTVVSKNEPIPECYILHYFHVVYMDVC